MKKYIFLFLFGVLMFVLTFLVALGFFNETKDDYVSSELEKARAFREISQNRITKETSFEEEKIGVNTRLVIEKKYSECGHITETVDIVEKDMVNLNKEEFEEKFPNYNVIDFTKNEVKVEENVKGYCKEHFKIALGEDFIEVFRMNSRGEDELYLVTNISRDYLAQRDVDKLSKGIEIYGEENINSKLEDYE